MRKVAIPLINNQLSEYFAQCNYFQIFEIENNSIIASEQEEYQSNFFFKISDWFIEKGITDVIAYKIDKHYVNVFSDTKINLFMGIPINTAEMLMEKYLDGSLKSDVKIINAITKNTDS